jgi:pyridoxal/pyridoxine/pyridoxamine kinase
MEETTENVVSCSTPGCSYIACEFFRLSKMVDEPLWLVAACSKCARNLIKVAPRQTVVERISILTFITEEVMKELAQVSYITFIHKDNVHDLEL